jgi:hypothetical protein
MLRQEELWGVQHHPIFPTGRGSERLREIAAAKAEQCKAENTARASSGYLAWDLILMEEVFEALGEEDVEKMIVELTQVAAVAATMIEDLRRHAGA